MKRMELLGITVASGGLCLMSWGAFTIGYIPLWAYEMVLVLLFPVFLLFLALWWKASEGEEDIPFIGY